MIRYGNRLTLSEVDVRRWTRITGFEPTAIATVADLEEYVRECKRYYAEPSDDSAFLNWLMDVELERYGGRPAGNRPVQLAAVSPDHARTDTERESRLRLLEHAAAWDKWIGCGLNSSTPGPCQAAGGAPVEPM